MPKLKTMITICTGTLALTALTPVSPAIAQWMINGKTLSGTETAALATTAAVDENFQLKAAGVTTTCTGNTLESTSPELAASGEMYDESTLKIRQCSANSGCIGPNTINFTSILVDVAPFLLIFTKQKVLPKTKTTLATIKFEGATCALLGVQPLTGKFLLNGPTGQEERTLQEIQAAATEESAELKLGSSSAELKGEALLKLVSGATWSFL